MRWQFSIRQLLIWTAVIGILMGTLGQMGSFIIAIVSTVWVTCLIGLRPNGLWWRWPVLFIPWITLVIWGVSYPIGMGAPWVGAVIVYGGLSQVAWLFLNMVWIRALGYRLVKVLDTMSVPAVAIRSGRRDAFGRF